MSSFDLASAPSARPADSDAPSVPQPYDGQNRPCEVCSEPVVVTARTDRVVHHRCVLDTHVFAEDYVAPKVLEVATLWDQP